MEDGLKATQDFLFTISLIAKLWEGERDDLIFHQSRRNMAPAGGSILQQQQH